MLLSSLLPPAFNVTIRSDRRGTCKGTHLVYACVGYCESSAFPSRYSVLVASNFTHNITSTSRCCTISKDAKVKGGGCNGQWKEGLITASGFLSFFQLLMSSGLSSLRSKFVWTVLEVATTTRLRSWQQRRVVATCAASPATDISRHTKCTQG